MALHNTVVLV